MQAHMAGMTTHARSPAHKSFQTPNQQARSLEAWCLAHLLLNVPLLDPCSRAASARQAVPRRDARGGGRQVSLAVYTPAVQTSAQGAALVTTDWRVGCVSFQFCKLLCLSIQAGNQLVEPQEVDGKLAEEARKGRSRVILSAGRPAARSSRVWAALACAIARGSGNAAAHVVIVLVARRSGAAAAAARSRSRGPGVDAPLARCGNVTDGLVRQGLVRRRLCLQSRRVNRGRRRPVRGHPCHAHIRQRVAGRRPGRAVKEKGQGLAPVLKPSEEWGGERRRSAGGGVRTKSAQARRGSMRVTAWQAPAALALPRCGLCSLDVNPCDTAVVCITIVVHHPAQHCPEAPPAMQPAT